MSKHSEQEVSVDPDVYLADDSYHPQDFLSETTSLASQIYNGVMENGRRYQTMREDKYWSPSDDKQFESLEALHLVYMVLDSEESNPFFHAPVGDSPKHILDIGAGKGSWAIDVADHFPDTIVRGVDLFPPPVTWMPPNCLLEIDDVLQEWTWRDPFDLIHMRFMLGAFTPEEWDTVYKQCYDHLNPGGWIEQTETGIAVYCDDGTVSEDNVLMTWGPNTVEASKRSGRPIDTADTMRDAVAKAGFVDIHEKAYKLPVGPWAKDPILKEAGRINYHHWSTGLEGWGMWLLTKFGDPPWAKEEVQIYTADIRKEIKKSRQHPYQLVKRVWARKPRPDEKVEKDDKEEKEKDEKSENGEKTA